MSGKRPATYQDVLAAPQHMVAELIDGELFLSPRPKGPHTAVASNLGVMLGSKFGHGDGGPGGWLILDEPELHLGKRVLVPDLAGWRLSRMSSVPDGHFKVAPDWVCEISSRSTERLDRKKKLPIYARAGVKHAWLIHPIARTLLVLRREKRHWLEVDWFAEADKVRAEPFKEVALDLSRLWMHQRFRASESYAHFEY